MCLSRFSQNLASALRAGGGTSPSHTLPLNMAFGHTVCPPQTNFSKYGLVWYVASYLFPTETCTIREAEKPLSKYTLTLVELPSLIWIWLKGLVMFVCGIYPVEKLYYSMKYELICVYCCASHKCEECPSNQEKNVAIITVKYVCTLMFACL